MVQSKNDFEALVRDQQEKIGAFKNVDHLKLFDYVNLVQENPAIAQLAPARIYNMVMKFGTKEVHESRKRKGYEDLVEYLFFKDQIFGIYEPIHDLMRFLKAAAMRTETGKRICMMMGPVSGAKSTIAALLKKGLENDDTPIYRIVGCPINEDPFHVIPDLKGTRQEWNEKLGIRIEGDLCPVCQKNLDDNFTDENGILRWDQVPIEMFRISEQRRTGIGTFVPSDPKSQDITELIGKVNVSKLAYLDEGDPEAFSFDGEIQIASRGMMEYIEILKADTKFHHVLITLAQEQKIKSPGFPQMYVDELVLSHTNEAEFIKFADNEDNQALHDRIYYFNVPWNDAVDDEINVYKKLIGLSEFSDVHIAPGALEVAAQFAILTRLHPTTKVSLIDKMKLYNNQHVEGFSRGKDINVKEMRDEGAANEECMKGVSPRFIINAINIALGAKDNVETGDERWKGCIHGIDMIRTLQNNFKHHMGNNEKDVQKFKELLISKENSIVSEFKEFAKKQVSQSFVYAFDDQANELFYRYDINCKADCMNETVFDEITGEYMKPDEKIMRALEELVPVPNEARKEFRKGVYVYKSDCLEKGKEWRWDSYEPIKFAIEKKLEHDLRRVVKVSIADPTITSEKAKKRRSDALGVLKDKGYCEHCASAMLGFVGEILRREN